MAISQNSTGGGPATHAGTNYQNRVAAWVAVHILAEQDAAPPWDLPATLTLESLYAETPNIIDDLEVRTSAGGRALVQVKHTVNLETTPGSPLGKTIAQFVAEYCGAKAPFDPAKDRFVLITSPTSSAKIRVHLPAFLTRVRTSPDPAAEWIAGSNDDQEAARALRDHVTREWHDLTGADPTPDELTGLVRLVHVHILDVDQGGQAEHEAKEHLRKSVLADPTAADAAWHTIITATAAYAVNAQRADRHALQRSLTSAGISIRAPRSYHEDIDRLKLHTQKTMQALREFSRIPVGHQTVVIARAATAELQTAVVDGHLLILGMPGAGKSGALHELATLLLAQDADMVVCAVDQLEAASTGALRTELGLTHDLTTILANWPGKGPAYLLIDALDAARTDGAIKTLHAIITEVIANNQRWHVVASVRKFDLRYNPTLQRVFHGTPPSSTYADQEFAHTRHLKIPTLTDTELAQVQPQSPALAALMTGAPAPLQDLLRLPFNLRLLGDLLGAGMSAADLQPVRTQVELLDRYWQERIIRHDHHGDARELVLARATTAMITNRALRIPRATAMGQDTAASAILHDLLSTHVLAEWTTQAGNAQRDFLTFPHHVLFDYAGARLYIPPEPDSFIARLAQEPDLLIAIRPSIELHYQRLWHLDQQAFWDLLFRTLAAPGIPEVGRLLGPSVAARHASTSGQIQPLLDAVQDPARHDVGIAALRHVLATLTSHGTLQASPWTEFLTKASDPLAADVAIAIRPYTFLLAGRAGELTPAEQAHLGLLGRRLLAYGLWSTPQEHTCIYAGIKASTSTISTDPAATVALLRSCITPEYLAANGYRTLHTLADAVPLIATVDPPFVRDLYVAALHHQETSTDATLMGESQILPLRSNRQQDYRHGLWSLGEQYPSFLQHAPFHAARALRTIIDEYVRRIHHNSDPQPQPVQYESMQTTLLTDYSGSWDRGNVYEHDAPVKMLNDLQRYLEAQADDPHGLSICTGLLLILLADPTLGVLWRRVLQAGTQRPASLGHVLRSLAWDNTILTAHDTTRVAGEFLRTVYPTLDPADRERIENTILNIPSTLQPASAAEHYHDRLLGCLPLALLVTAGAKTHSARLLQQGGPPPNQEDEGGAFWVDPHPANEHDPLHQLVQPLTTFINEHRNQTPATDAITAALSHVAALNAALDQPSATPKSLAYSTLAGACTTMARNNEFPQTSTDCALLKTAAHKAIAQADPTPDPERDASIEKGHGWPAAARTEGAEAIMALARHQECIDEELRATITSLATDPVAAVRLQIAHHLGYLYRTAPDLMWDLLTHFAEHEQNRGVVRGTLDVLQRIAGNHPDKTAALATIMFNRINDGVGAREVRDACVNIFGGLSVWHQESQSTAMIDVLLADPAQYHDELHHVIFSAGAWLVSDKHGINHHAFALLDRTLNILIKATQDLEAHHAGPAAWPEPAAAAYRGLVQCEDEVASRLHQAAKGFDENTTTEREEVYRQARPLLSRLAGVGHPHIAHSVLETLALFIPADPPGVLLLAGEVVQTGSKYGYQYESLAEGLIVQIVERYLAEYRPTLREHRECHQVLMDILDVFVRVGWPSAHRLTYRLGDIYR